MGLVSLSNRQEGGSWRIERKGKPGMNLGLAIPGASAVESKDCLEDLGCMVDLPRS